MEQKRSFLASFPLNRIMGCKWNIILSSNDKKTDLGVISENPFFSFIDIPFIKVYRAVQSCIVTKKWGFS